MSENTKTEVVNNESTKTFGLNIAAIVLGIISIVLWCAWFISIPCAILALIFGIIGIKKKGRGLAITGIVTGSITLAIWVLLFIGAFTFGFIEGITETTTPSYSSSRYLY